MYIVNGKRLSEEEYRAWEAERLAFLAETDSGIDAAFRDGRAPGCRTDREFLFGHCNGNQFEKTPDVGDDYRAKAEAAGVSTTGKIYLSGLARFSGDPEAWVSDRGDVQRAVEKRPGWSCEGAVTTAAPPIDQEPKKVRMHPRIVKRIAKQMIAADPALAKKPAEEIKEMVIDKHGAPK